MFTKGDISVFTCDNGHATVTISRVDGAITMAIHCPDCGKKATLTGSDPSLTPTQEWFKPKPGEYPQQYAQYVAMGGLLLRKIDTRPAHQPLKAPGDKPSETYLEFPRRSHSRAWCKQFDQYCKSAVPGNYKGLKGRKFWFAFESEEKRDIFLAEMAKAFETYGTTFEKTETTAA